MLPPCPRYTATLMRPVLRSRHLPRRGRPGQRRVRRAGADLAQPRWPAPRADRDARPVPAARGRQGAARSGVRRARRPGGHERSRRGRRHERRVSLVADRTRRTTVRRQRGVDQAAAGPTGTRPARRALTVSRPLGLRRSGTAEPSPPAATRYRCEPEPANRRDTPLPLTAAQTRPDLAIRRPRGEGCAK
jgi:hypothetical protein